MQHALRVTQTVWILQMHIYAATFLQINLKCKQNNI
jgi:hypothetical protein